MNFIKTIFIILFTFLSSSAFADQHDLNSNNQTTAQTTEINNENEDIEEEVPLNDPFAGNEGTGSGSNIPEEEQEKYPDPTNPGTFYKNRMDMKNLKRYDKLCFMDAAEELGMFAKEAIVIENED